MTAPEWVYVDPATGLPVATKEKRFDLDFPGGGPADFIRVVSEARGKPVNAIIPDGLPPIQLPEMHLKQVTIPQLFEALQAASQSSQQGESYRFVPTGKSDEDSIWTLLYRMRPNPPPTELAPARVVRFYQLGPYLDSYKFDDITTAIQTGWKMLAAAAPPPSMKFHKETKLLIAVGEPAQLRIIEEVLSQLATGGGTPQPAMATPRPPSLPSPQPPPPLPAPAQ